jgi:hypothetical protein
MDMRAVLRANLCADLNLALVEDLPFRIPVMDSQLVQQYPDVFEWSDSNIDLAVRSFLEYTKVGHSEASTVVIDGHWLKALLRCISGMDILYNEHGGSSLQSKRYDASVQIFDALALRGEVKVGVSDLMVAFKELASQFHKDAYKVFPTGCSTIVGVASCTDRIHMHLITHDPGTGGYSSQLHRAYDASGVPGRVDFLIDLMKVCRWMASIAGCNSAFHLKPAVRRRTKNGHHITWVREGIYKEFDHRRDTRRAVRITNQVYTHVPRLIHMEYGRVIDDRSIMITRIGNRLTLANMAKQGLTKESVVEQVLLGLQELHNIGFAHCDVSVENVFVDECGVVFLGDLEYLTPVDDPAQHFTRLPAGVADAEVSRAQQLDDYQFQRFTAEVNRM